MSPRMRGVGQLSNWLIYVAHLLQMIWGSILLIHDRINKRTYSYLVDQVASNLTAWKSKSLSLAGRVTLIKAVTSSIPIYAMQTAKLPETIYNSLDKLNRYFLCIHNGDNNPIHLVNWKIDTSTVENRGLWVKRTRFMNQALLAKIGWRLQQNKNMLWASLYSGKYLGRSDLSNAPNYL